VKTLTIALSFIIFFAGVAFARDPYGRGYTRRDGTYVEPRYGTIPNHTRNDSSPTRETANPTGRPGAKNPDPYDPRYNKQYNRPAYR
jgi:hypothetical protein